MPLWEKYLDEDSEIVQFEKFIRRKKNMKLDGETLTEKQERKERERKEDEQKRIANREEMQDS